MNYCKGPFTILAACLLLTPERTAAQSLGEIAREVREERQKLSQKAVNVYTNDNIGKWSRSEAASPPTAEPTPTPAKPPAAEAKLALQHGKKPVKKIVKTKEYWEVKFRKDRAALARAQEEQQLVEDELSLLQIQEVRELDPNLSRKLSAQISAKKTELDCKRAATAKAQKALDELNKEFEKSGAPEDWRGQSAPH